MENNHTVQPPDHYENACDALAERAIKQAAAMIKAGRRPPSRHDDRITHLRMVSYEITHEPLSEGNPPETPEIASRYEELHPSQHEPEALPALLSELEALHNTFPDDAKIANYLAGVYGLLERIEDMDRICEDLYRRHPDYLFAIAAIIRIYLSRKEVAKAEAILNGRIELSLMYPDRKIFHISEFIAFYDMIVRYHLVREKIDEARTALTLFKQVAPDHPTIARFETILAVHDMYTHLKSMSGKQRRATRSAKRKNQKIIRATP